MAAAGEQPTAATTGRMLLVEDTEDGTTPSKQADNSLERMLLVKEDSNGQTGPVQPRQERDSGTTRSVCLVGPGFPTARTVASELDCLLVCGPLARRVDMLDREDVERTYPYRNRRRLRRRAEDLSLPHLSTTQKTWRELIVTIGCNFCSVMGRS